MNYMELNNNIDTQRIYKYRNKILNISSQFSKLNIYKV